MILCAGRNETFDFALPIGVGLVESAINLTAIMIDKKPSSLHFVGSAGSYGNHQIFDIIHSCVATNVENSYFTHGAYSPLENKIVSRETSEVINSSNYITTDKSLSCYYQEAGITAENMEFYAIMMVAQKYNIPCSGDFIITNYCDEHAHKDFIHHHEKAKTLLSNYIKEYYEI